MTLREVRLSRGLTQKQLAKAAGIAETCYQNIERGRNLPTLPNAFSIASVLGSTVDALFGEEGKISALR